MTEQQIGIGKEENMKQYVKILSLCVLSAFMMSGCSDRSEPQKEEVSKGSIVAEGSSAEDTSVSDALSFYGIWYIWDYQAAEVSAVSADTVEKLGQSTITYAGDSITLDGNSFEIDRYTYDTEKYTYERMLEDYNANLGEWWSEIDSVSLVSVAVGEDFLGKNFFVVSDNVIWIYYEGVFFLARREARPQ
ncbi:MAG: hypothetical protein Q4D31_01675 [Eubacteriales bacterium]|nr:hypothetical protein [Eubacteriales bacterium]